MFAVSATVAAGVLIGAGLVGVAPAARAAAIDSAQTEVSSTGAVSSIVKTADLSQFKPGNIISDAVFFNSATMTEAQIQSFLESKVPSCRSGYTCLKDYVVQTRSIAADAMCGAYSGGGSERASRVIFKVSQACGINPQVILVMLQKEQGLITSTAPSAWAYQAAMGQGCPDTAACDSAYYGLFNQVYGGARQMKRYANPPGTSNYFTWYAPGKTWNVGYHPNASCGSGAVYIENQATANLYYYTPYQPNAAALAAGYGLGDGCSSYGNRNFFNYFTDWFGSTQSTGGDPFGGFNLVVARGQFTVQGWAIDRDKFTSPVKISLTVDGQSDWGTFTANASRPDVGAAYPGAGDNHGMNATFEILGGDHTVCVTAINVGNGANASFGCQTISVTTSSPYGGVTVDVIPGGVHISGWTLDTDTKAAIPVHVYADGKGKAFTANASRPDVGKAFPGMGDNHGIDIDLPLSVGTHEVCVYGINSGPGFNVLLGCSTVKVISDGNPVGALDSLVAVPGGVRVSGWAIDPSGSGAIAVHLYNGATAVATTADRERKDIPSSYADYGTAHGFLKTVKTGSGPQQICAYGIDKGLGSNALLGCSTVTVLSGSPFGGMNTVLASKGVTVQGWAIDPDTADPVKVHIYVDGKGTEVTADQSRPDVGRVYRGYGADHGIDASFSVPEGQHSVCAYAINQGAGSNTLLGCSTVTVPSRSPFGGMNTVLNGKTVAVQGWAIDPDTADPIKVHVYVDGVGTEVIANASRPDVGAAYPRYGASHGIDASFKLSGGNHTICVYGINEGSGSNTLLGCSSVSVPTGSPFGGTDVTVSGTEVRLRGWAIDPDTADSIEAHVYVDGAPVAAVTADADRPDVGRAYPGFGSAHGIDTRLKLTPGSHQICTYAINVGSGDNALLACQTLAIGSSG